MLKYLLPVFPAKPISARDILQGKPLGIPMMTISLDEHQVKPVQARCQILIDDFVETTETLKGSKN